MTFDDDNLKAVYGYAKRGISFDEVLKMTGLRRPALVRMWDYVQHQIKRERDLDMKRKSNVEGTS